MPDWGGIGGLNLAAGLLNGLAQGYEHASRDSRRDALIQQERAYRQQDELFRTFSGLIQQNPGITTNPGFHNMIQSAGLDPERAQALGVISQAIAADPGVQRKKDHDELLGKLRDQIAAKYGQEQMPADVAGPPGPGASLDTMSAKEGFFLGGAPLAQAAGVDQKTQGGGGLTANQQRLADQFQQKEARVGGEQERKRKLGVVEERQTPVGLRKVRVVTDPDTGTATVKPLGGVKQSPADTSVVQSMATINTALKISDKLAATLNRSPAKMAKLFTPFVGKTLDEVYSNVGALDPEQKQFLLRVLELRNQRLNVQGGKALTETEERLYNQTLPSDLNTVIAMVPTTVQHVLETLTTTGANLEAASEQAGKRAPRTVALPYNRDFYKHVRRTSKHAYRHAAQVPLNPGETLTTGGAPSAVPSGSAQDRLQRFYETGETGE